jgi:pimeloyl-ACP methyl ester carboxylesterase
MDSPSLILLHGGAQTAHSWDTAAFRLAVRYRVIVLDQRGHGLSDWSMERDYTRDAFAGDVLALMEHLQLARATLAGVSLGGLNALQFASLHPDRLNALIVIDIGGEVDPEGSSRIRSFMQAREKFASLNEAADHVLQFNPRRSRGRLLRSLRHNLIQDPDGEWTWRYDGYFRESERWSEPTNAAASWAQIEQIKVPSLVVRGAESDVFTVAMATELAHRLPNAKLVEVPHAGHAVPSDNPDGFSEAVLSFLEHLQVKLHA